MTKKILFILFLFSSIIHSQEDDRFHFYKMDGTEYIIREKEPITIKYFEENYIKEYKYTHAHTNFDLYNNETKTGILAIYYAEFTDIPLYVLGNKPSERDISLALSTFNYDKYLKDWEFDYNLKKYINDRKLITDDLYKIFGKPNRIRESTSYTKFTYKKLNLTFTIRKDIVIDFSHTK